MDSIPTVPNVQSEALGFAVKAGFKPALFYTVPQTAQYLGIGRDVLYAEIRAERLKAFTPPCGGWQRLAVTEVDEWLKSN